MMMLDACHVGSGSKGVSGIAPDATEKSNLVCLLSSGSDQLSYPYEEKEHSVFTYYLLQGLAGKAADQRSLSTGKSQMPRIVGEPEKPLVLTEFRD